MTLEDLWETVKNIFITLGQQQRSMSHFQFPLILKIPVQTLLINSATSDKSFRKISIVQAAYHNAFAG